MKKLIATLSILMVYFTNAQSWDLAGNSGIAISNYLGTTDTKPIIFKTNSLERMIINSDGNVGIGTSLPTNKLDVIGTGRFRSSTTGDTFQISNDEQTVNTGSDLLWLSYAQYQTNSVGALTITSRNANNQIETALSVRANGKTFMGTEFNNLAVTNCNDCSSYRLFVKDGIKTEKVKVEFANVNGWADYVFNDDYKLMSLNEIEKFIIKNKHLPEVPTAEEVVKNGIELKEMNVLLLKKVEEITLLLIKVNKKVEVLENKIKSIESK